MGMLDLAGHMPAGVSALGDAPMVAVAVLASLCLVAVVAASACAAVRDARERVIPNGCCLCVALCGLSVQAVRIMLQNTTSELWFIGRVLDALPEPGACVAWAAGLLVAGVAAELAVRRLTGRTGLGLGDVKFVAAWACILGFYVLPALAAACLLGAAWALVRRERTFAMAPWLTLSFVAVLALIAS